MKLPLLDNNSATTLWNCFESTGAFNGSSLALEYSGAEEDAPLTDLDLEELAEELSAIKSGFEKRFPQGLPKAFGGEVDSLIVKPVHNRLSKIASVSQLSNLAFWRWLSNMALSGAFWKFIAWRYEDKKQINWGITSPSQAIEVYFYRAWLRGHMMYDASLSDPYKYAKKGNSDIWRSHILRQDFGKDREFVKAFLDTVIDEQTDKVKISSNKLRSVLIPALRAWTASATFSNLSYQECKDLIEQLLEQGI